MLYLMIKVLLSSILLLLSFESYGWSYIERDYPKSLGGVFSLKNNFDKKLFNLNFGEKIEPCELSYSVYTCYSGDVRYEYYLDSSKKVYLIIIILPNNIREETLKNKKLAEKIILDTNFIFSSEMKKKLIEYLNIINYKLENGDFISDFEYKLSSNIFINFYDRDVFLGDKGRGSYSFYLYQK